MKYTSLVYLLSSSWRLVSPKSKTIVSSLSSWLFHSWCLDVIKHLSAYVCLTHYIIDFEVKVDGSKSRTDKSSTRVFNGEKHIQRCMGYIYDEFLIHEVWVYYFLVTRSLVHLHAKPLTLFSVWPTQNGFDVFLLDRTCRRHVWNFVDQNKRAPPPATWPTVDATQPSSHSFLFRTYQPYSLSIQFKPPSPTWSLRFVGHQR